METKLTKPSGDNIRKNIVTPTTNTKTIPDILSSPGGDKTQSLLSALLQAHQKQEENTHSMMGAMTMALSSLTNRLVNLEEKLSDTNKTSQQPIEADVSSDLATSLKEVLKEVSKLANPTSPIVGLETEPEEESAKENLAACTAQLEAFDAAAQLDSFEETEEETEEEMPDLENAEEIEANPMDPESVVAESDRLENIRNQMVSCLTAFHEKSITATEAMKFRYALPSAHQ